MARKARSPDKAVPVVLGEDLRIGNAAAAFAALGGPVSGTLTIDASRVARADCAGLQAVAAALLRLRNAGFPWRWHSPSGAFTSAARLAGLEEALQLAASQEDAP